MIRVQQAIVSLRPGAEWTMTDDDVENMIWHTEGVQPLTKAEVEAEVKRLEQAAADEAAEKEAARESAMSKLSALGLTVSEIKSIVG